MKFFALAAALLVAQVNGEVGYTVVDDPRCHDEPSNPVIPPTPSPEPYPTPPTPIEEFPKGTSAPTTPAPTPEPTTAAPVLPPIVCDGALTHFALIEANTGQAVPGYDNIKGYLDLDLDNILPYLPLSLQAFGNGLNGAKFKCADCNWQSDHEHSEGHWPYAMNGDSNGGTQFGAVSDLVTPGTYTILGIGKVNGNFQSDDEACKLVVTVTMDGEESDPTDPDDPFETIDNTDYCAPEQIKLATEGTAVPDAPLIQILYESTITNETVFFKTNNTINGQPMDWITTSFVTTSGVEVCDKIENFGYHTVSEHIYEAKCHGGFAYADVYAYSTGFDPATATADTTLLPAACRNSAEGQVIKYSYVFSCDCDAVPDVPDEVSGNDPKPPHCYGAEGKIFGEPHVYPYDATAFNCQGEGEYLLTKMDIAGRDYGFQMNGRFTRYRWMDDDNANMPWTWNDGIAISTDVDVQLSVAEVPNDHSMQFNDMYINFFVEGNQRKLWEGSGDHRVEVTINNRYITLFFASTGIQVMVEVRAFSTTSALQGVMDRDSAEGMQIPGCFTTTICIPSLNDKLENFVGLLGTPNGDKADDYKNLAGDIIAVPEPDKHWKDRTPYCEENWCLPHLHQSLFVNDANHGFSFYNYCTNGGSRRLSDGETSCTLPVEAQGICAEHCEAEDVPQCEVELCAGLDMGVGEQTVNIFCGDIESHRVHVRMAIYDPAQDDFAGCSVDHKTTVKSSDPTEAAAGFAECTNEFDCAECTGDPNAVWLSSGDLSGCFGLGADVTGTDPCCGILENVGGVCELPVRRKLELKDIRPDIPEKRNILPLHSEL